MTAYENWKVEQRCFGQFVRVSEKFIRREDTSSGEGQFEDVNERKQTQGLRLQKRKEEMRLRNNIS